MDDGQHHYDFEQESRHQQRVNISDGIGGVVAVAFMVFCGVIYGIFNLLRRK